MIKFFQHTLLFSFIFITQSVIAQDKSNAKKESERLMTLYHQLAGTYQIQVIDSRELPALPLTYMDSILIIREKYVVKYIWIKNNIRIKILPKSEVDSPSFKPLERVVYIPSNDKYIQ